MYALLFSQVRGHSQLPSWADLCYDKTILQDFKMVSPHLVKNKINFAELERRLPNQDCQRKHHMWKSILSAFLVFRG